MNEKDFNIRTKVIQKRFNDTRKIKCQTPEKVRKVDEHIYPGGDIFTTEDGDFIDLELQTDDFDEDELIKYIELAEALYEKHERHVSIYIICPKFVNITVKECPIFSKADFTIKLTYIDEDPYEIILNGIKNKVKNGEMLDEEDMMAILTLPEICEPKKRNYFLKEYLKVMKKIL